MCTLAFFSIDVCAGGGEQGTSWWVKGDGCDTTAGLGESERNVWSGDVDLGDGKLQALYNQCLKRQKFVKGWV